MAFHPAAGPSDAAVAAALVTIRHRVQRLLVRHGLEPADDATGPADRLTEESPVLAGIVAASVQGRVALGQRAGARVRRLGDARDTATVISRGPRQAHLEGFDLHANVWVSGNDRAGVERLCRYILRPPFAQERLRFRSDGRIVLELKTPWHDGTRELVFEPLELLERLAAMTPRPETNLLICHGLLAARARWRMRVVAYGRVVAEPTAMAPALVASAERTQAKSGSGASSWAALMHRAFAIDVLACPHCGGRLRLIATLHDPAVIGKLLAHLGMAPSGPSPANPPPPRPDRFRPGGRCRARAASSVRTRPGHDPGATCRLDGGGMRAYDAAHPGGSGWRARRLLMCAVEGSWGARSGSVRVGRRLCLGGRAPRDGATTAGGRSC